MFANSKDAIIGQDFILDKIDNYTLDTFPHTLLLEGDVGSGKHSICKYVAEHLGLEYCELLTNADRKDIDDIQFKPYPCLYVVDLTNIILKYQNSILKILEEPPTGAFFICLCTSASLVLPTILNRCIVWKLQRYTADILSKFVKNYSESGAKIALLAFNTPGKILAYEQEPVEEIYTFANNILDRVTRASLPSVLSIADKIAFKNEKGKYDLALFLEIFKVACGERVTTSNNSVYSNIYKITVDMVSKMNLNIAQSRVFDGFLVRLYEVSYGIS